MSQESFRAAFEDFAPRGLQGAFDYVDADDRVETIWITGIRDGDWASGQVAYRISGVVADLKTTAELLGLEDWNTGRYDESIDGVIDEITEILLRVGVRAENPTRVVIRYDVAEQAMSADFYYEPLRMGPEDTLRHVLVAWLERLRVTGNDAAAD